MVANVLAKLSQLRCFSSGHPPCSGAFIDKHLTRIFGDPGTPCPVAFGNRIGGIRIVWFPHRSGRDPF